VSEENAWVTVAGGYTLLTEEAILVGVIAAILARGA
jgi:hypothetical protein